MIYIMKQQIRPYLLSHRIFQANVIISFPQHGENLLGYDVVCVM